MTIVIHVRLPLRPPLRQFIAALLLAGYQLATAAGTSVGATTEIRIERGDTLIGMGKRLLAEPRKWPVLQKLNRISDPYHLRPGAFLLVPESLLRAEPVLATVESVSGNVDSSRGRLAEGMQLGSGDKLRTDAGAYAALRLPDGSRFVVQPETQLNLEQLRRLRGSQAQQSQLMVPQGRVDNHVAPQRGAGARYEIRTPTAIIGVRGTSFRAAYDANEAKSRIEVVEGTVESNARTRVTAGEGAVVDASGVRTAPLLAPPDTTDIPALFERPLIRLPLPQTAGAQAHRVIVSSTPDFSQPVFETLADGHEARIGDLPDGNYRLRLRAIGNNGLEGLDAETAFRLKARPEPPFPSLPTPNSKQRAEKVDFSWAEQPQASHYRIQIARDPAFTEIAADAEKLATTRFSTALPPGEYQWRLASIRAGNDNGPWGDPVPFTLKPLQGPPEPPAIGPDSVSFSWPAEPGQSFEFEMAADPQFQKIVLRRETNDATLVLPRPEAGEYLMRVRATDPDGYVGPWSGAQRFEVPHSRPWWLLLLIPLAFSL